MNQSSLDIVQAPLTAEETNAMVRLSRPARIVLLNFDRTAWERLLRYRRACVAGFFNERAAA